MKPKRRRMNPRPMRLRYEAQQQRIARLLLLGWTAERIARRMCCTARAVRYAISSEKFQAFFTAFQREHFKSLDRRMNRLLHGAIKALRRQLKHKDWRARDAAIEKVLRVHGKYVDKLELGGAVDHTGRVSHSHQHQIDLGPAMTDEQRTTTRLMLTAFRAAQQPKALPPALTANPLPEDSSKHREPVTK